MIGWSCPARSRRLMVSAEHPQRVQRVLREIKVSSAEGELWGWLLRDREAWAFLLGGVLIGTRVVPHC